MRLFSRELLPSLVLVFVLPFIAVVDARTCTIDPWEMATDRGAKNGDPLIHQDYGPGLAMVVGDTIIFNYGFGGTTQDVWIHPRNTCEQGGNPAPFRVKGTNGPGVYKFNRRDGDSFGKKVLFASDIGQHCENGQNIFVTVFDTHANRDNIQAGKNAVPDDISAASITCEEDENDPKPDDGELDDEDDGNNGNQGGNSGGGSGNSSTGNSSNNSSRGSSTRRPLPMATATTATIGIVMIMICLASAVL